MAIDAWGKDVKFSKTEEKPKEIKAWMPCWCGCSYVHMCKYYADIGWNHVILMYQFCPPSMGYTFDTLYGWLEKLKQDKEHSHRY